MNPRLIKILPFSKSYIVECWTVEKNQPECQFTTDRIEAIPIIVKFWIEDKYTEATMEKLLEAII